MLTKLRKRLTTTLVSCDKHHHHTSTRHRLNIVMTECEAHVAADVLCTQHGILHRLTRKHRGIARCVDGDRRNTSLHMRYHYAKAYTFAGITGKLRSTAELASGPGVRREMTAVMVAVALMAAWASPAARAQTNDTASYTYTGSIDSETVTTRRTCSVNVVGTPGPNNPCPEGPGPVVYPTGGWSQLVTPDNDSPTTLEAWYDRQTGNFRTALRGAFPNFASFMTAWTAGDNNWHNPFEVYATIPGLGRLFAAGGGTGTRFDQIVEMQCLPATAMESAQARFREFGDSTGLLAIDYSANINSGLLRLCQSTPYNITKQSVAAAASELGYDNGWSAWSAANIVDKNQTHTCNAGTGGRCTNDYSVGTTNHGQTETRPSETFWMNYLVNGPAGHTNATARNGADVISVTLSRNNNDGRLQLQSVRTTGGTNSVTAHITTGQATPSTGTLFESISLKPGLSRPNLSWTAIPGPGVVFYRPSANNGVVLLDSSCTASGDLRVRSGTTTDTEQTAQANSPLSLSLCNIGASASDITKQVIGELSATDNFIYDAALVSLGAIQDSTPNTPANVGDILISGALTHLRLTVNASAWQWQRCTTQNCSSATAISPGGTAGTYTVQAADQGNWLRVQVTQSGDFNDTLFSNIVRADRRGAIGTLTGAARVGGTLTAGAVTDPDASPNTDVGTITWQWQTATASAGPFTAAPGTNNTATYTIASDQSQIGSWLRVMASYPNAGGDSLTSGAVVVAGVRVSQTALNVTEGGTTTSYNLALGSQPTDAVTISVTSDNPAVTATSPLIFSTVNWNVAQTVMVTGAEDANATNESGVQLSHAVSSSDAGYAGLTPPAVTVGVTDNDMAGVTVTPTTLDMNEGETGIYTLMLTSQPANDVVITVASGDADAASVNPGTLTFTGANWNVARMVTVTGEQDDDANNEVSVRLTHTAESTDATYNGNAVTIAGVTVNVDDNDTAGVTLNASTLEVSEGGSGGYTLMLETRPMTDVTIMVVATGDTGAATVSPTSLTFTNVDWNTAKTVTVMGVEDSNATDGNVSLAHTVDNSSDVLYRPLMLTTVAVTVRDNDTPGVSVSPTRLEPAEGANVEYMLMLNTQPAADVMITVASGDMGAASVSPTTLTFTTADWNTGKTVTVTGEQDADADNEVNVQLTHTASSTDNTYNGNAVAITAVSVTVDDDETAGVTVSETELMFNEGTNNNTYTLVLDVQPSADMTISVMSNDAEAASVSPSTLSFTMGDWDTPKTFTVTGVEDADANNETVSLTHTFSGGGPAYADATPALTIAGVAVTVDDDETAGVTVSETNLTFDEGTTNTTYSLVLDVQPSADMTISVMSNDAEAASVSPSTLSFTMGDWDTPKVFTVTGVEDADANNETVSLTHTFSGGGPAYANATPALTIAGVTVTVDDDETAGVTLSETELMFNEGTANTTYTLVLDTQPTAAMVITVMSDDEGAASVSPATLTFTMADWNAPKPVTVTGIADADANNESVSLTHTFSGGGPAYADANPALTIAGVTVTVDDDETAGVTLSETELMFDEGTNTTTYTLVLDAQPSAAMVITVMSDDDGAVSVSPATLPFAMDDWNTPKMVTVTGEQDLDANNESVSLTHTFSGGGPAYADANPAVTIDAVTVTVNDDETAGVMVTPTTLSVTENDTRTYTLVLTSQPRAEVRIAVTSADATEATVSPATLTFAIDEWNRVQTVTVTGVEDVDVDNESVRLTHTVSSTDTGYAAVTPDAVLVTVTELAISLDVDNSGGAPNQGDGLMIGRYLFGIRDMVGLLDTIPGSPSFSVVTANIARAVASGRLDVDGSGGAANQGDGLMIGRYLFGIRDTVGLLDTIPGNPSFNDVTRNIGALVRVR